MHKWQASKFQDIPRVHFIHNDSGNGSPETSAHPQRFSEYAKTGPATHICHCLPGLMNSFIPNVSTLPQHRTANWVLKSILLLTVAAENLINLKVYGWLLGVSRLWFVLSDPRQIEESTAAEENIQKRCNKEQHLELVKEKQRKRRMHESEQMRSENQDRTGQELHGSFMGGEGETSINKKIKKTERWTVTSLSAIGFPVIAALRKFYSRYSAHKRSAI